MLSFLIYYLIKLCLSFRYEIKISDKQKLESLYPKKGVLFLANHVALVDPIILMSVLWKGFKPSPVASIDLFEDKFINFFMKRVRGIPIGNFSNLKNRKKALETTIQALNIIKERLSNGGNILLYPSGCLSKDGIEKIKNSSTAFNILSSNIPIKLVLIKTKGLWGSSFSRQPYGKTPSLGKTLLKSVFIIVKNLFLLTPKRVVTIDIEVVNKHEFSSKKECNFFLENFFNINTSSKPVKLPYIFWNSFFKTKEKDDKKIF